MIFGRKTTIVVPLDSREDILEALRTELESASEEHRAGLVRAIDVVTTMEINDHTMQRRYAQRLLAEEGVDPVADRILSIDVLRRRIPGLGVAAATGLVDLAAHEGTLPPES